MEFLPLCDVLFNIISLAGYFCDVVFDVVFCYALLERGQTTYSVVVICSITFSLITSQVCGLIFTVYGRESVVVKCKHFTITREGIVLSAVCETLTHSHVTSKTK